MQPRASMPPGMPLDDSISMTVRIPPHQVLTLHVALRRAAAMPAEVRIIGTDAAGGPTTMMLRGTRHHIDAAMHVVMCELPQAEFGAIHAMTAVFR
ncbi:hypothetical protein [Bordetella genomosp. 13]|uniref:Uncharacterized protein n=1 Tax=Bordetella genomosp. 13 TaxID=463040 RepID=A0A1W6ZFB6_9BORD|nr:hypothetical protein [Bordetella genomosp. 13]ARP96076.1 hypothetical protein CAL15_17860 [Bordetella genomosp. 13]